jgi:hypothetical protein
VAPNISSATAKPVGFAPTFSTAPENSEPSVKRKVRGKPILPLPTSASHLTDAGSVYAHKKLFVGGFRHTDALDSNDIWRTPIDQSTPPSSFRDEQGMIGVVISWGRPRR